MKKPCSYLPLLAATALFALAGCGDRDREPLSGPGGEPVIFVSIAPAEFLVKRVAGDKFSVRPLVEANRDPHDFSPSPKLLVELGGSAAFFTTGMPFEESLVENLNQGTRGLKIIDLTQGIELHEYDCQHHDHEHENGEGEEHDHDDHHDHDHGEYDTHIWLSPPLLVQQTATIVKALSELDPENAELFQTNGALLQGEISDLHKELTAKLAPAKGRKFYVYHGAFAYFANAYGLVQEAIEIGGRKPEQKRVFELIESAKEEGVKTIIVQPQFDPESAKTIAGAIGGEVISIDPMERDLFQNLRKLSEAIPGGQGGE